MGNPKHLGSEPESCRGRLGAHLLQLPEGAPPGLAGLTLVREGEEAPENVACRDWRIPPPGGKGGWKAKGEEALEEPSVAGLTVSERFHTTSNK